MNSSFDKILTSLLSIATSGVIFCCGFMWKSNASQARMEQHQIEKDKIIDDLNLKMNNLQLDTRALRDDVIELKTIIKSK